MTEARKPVDRKLKTKGDKTMEEQLRLDGTKETKGENAMDEKEFNVFNYTKNLLCKEYLKSKSKDFTVNVRYWNDYKENGYNISGARPVFYTLARDGGIQSYEVKEVTEAVDGKMKTTYEIKITGFNPNAKGKSKKTGKQYDIYGYAMKNMLYKQFANNEVTA